MFTGVDYPNDGWAEDDIKSLGGGDDNSNDDDDDQDDSSRKKLYSFRQSDNDASEERFRFYQSYFETSVDPDRPRFVKAVYDSQRPVRNKAINGQYRPFLQGIDQQAEKELYFGRTRNQLLACFGYYIALWSFLVGITAGLLTLHLRTGWFVSNNQPRFLTRESAMALISQRDYPHPHYYGNPALAFRPLNYDDSNLIWFIPGPRHPETWAPLVGSLDAFLEHYSEKKFYGCTDCSKKPFPIDIEKDIYLYDKGAMGKTYCCFYIKDLGRECTKQRGYGYIEGKPCVLLKLNRIINWMPLLYANASEAPEEIRDRFSEKHIGVKCFGIHPSDKEHIGEIAYYPPEGFPYYHWPYRNQIRYRSPLVFMQFLNATPGVLIMVECRAYAKNIEIDGPSMMGSVRFEIMIDVSVGAPQKNSAAGWLCGFGLTFSRSIWLVTTTFICCFYVQYFSSSS